MFSVHNVLFERLYYPSCVKMVTNLVVWVLHNHAEHPVRLCRTGTLCRCAFIMEMRISVISLKLDQNHVISIAIHDRRWNLIAINSVYTIPCPSSLVHTDTITRLHFIRSMFWSLFPPVKRRGNAFAHVCLCVSLCCKCSNFQKLERLYFAGTSSVSRSPRS